MKNILCTAALAAGLAAAGAAHAQGYVGASVGQARVNLDCAGTDTCDKTDTAFKLFGGYLFTPNWGVEGAYYDQGKLKQTATDPALGSVSATWKGSALAAFGVGQVPLGKAAVFGKLGLAYAKVKADVTSSVLGAASESENHTNLAWGVGASYGFTKNLGARFEYEAIRLQFQDEKKWANMWSVGVVYAF